MILLISVLWITGCDQQPPEIAASTFSLSGNIYEYDYLRGVSDKDKPIGQATITVAGPASASTTTSTSGAYSFVGLPLGEYIVTVSKEGYQRDGKPAYSVTYDFSASSIADSTQVLDLALDPRPIFMGSSVSNYEEVPTSVSSFEIRFSEAMSRETVTAFVKMLSLRSAAVSQQGIATSSISWSSDSKTMILTLGAPLTADALYQIGVACSNSGFGIEGIRDQQGNPIYGTQTSDSDLYNSSVDSHYGTYIYIPFKTVSDKSAIPATPTALSVRSSATGNTEVDYNSVFSAASGVDLIFTGSSEANGYRVYVSADGSDYSFAKEFSTTSVFVSVYDVVTALGSHIACGYDGFGYPVDPGLPWPFLGSGTYLKVSAYNSLGGSAMSNALLVKDTVKPTAESIVVSESDTEKVIKFSEPLNRSSAENAANYVLQGGGPAVVSATLINDYTGTLVAYGKTYVRLALAASDAGPRTIRINGVKDLTGNQIKVDTDVNY
jgi:hypothetical protein